MYNTYQRVFLKLKLFDGTTHPLIARRRFNYSQAAHIPCVLLDGCAKLSHEMKTISKNTQIRKNTTTKTTKAALTISEWVTQHVKIFFRGNELQTKDEILWLPREGVIGFRAQCKIKMTLRCSAAPASVQRCKKQWTWCSCYFFPNLILGVLCEL